MYHEVFIYWYFAAIIAISLKLIISLCAQVYKKAIVCGDSCMSPSLQLTLSFAYAPEHGKKHPCFQASLIQFLTADKHRELFIAKSPGNNLWTPSFVLSSIDPHLQPQKSMKYSFGHKSYPTLFCDEINYEWCSWYLLDDSIKLILIHSREQSYLSVLICSLRFIMMHGF